MVVVRLGVNLAALAAFDNGAMGVMVTDIDEKFRLAAAAAIGLVAAAFAQRFPRGMLFDIGALGVVGINNDHVELHDVRGFASDDLPGAFSEADAIAKGTRCEKDLFSMSLNPPEGADASVEAYEHAIEQVEQKLGLENQPRAISAA